MRTPPNANRSSQLVDRQRLLDEFDIITEEDVAALCGCTLKSFRNRPRSKKPKMAKIGDNQVSTRAWIREYLESCVVEDDTRLRRETVAIPPRARQKQRKTAAGADAAGG
jgi:hypothetical protein